MSTTTDAILSVLLAVGVAVVLFGSLVFGDPSTSPAAPGQVPGRELPVDGW